MSKACTRAPPLTAPGGPQRRATFPSRGSEGSLTAPAPPPVRPPARRRPAGYAHSGFLTAARWLFAQTFEAIKGEVESHAGYSLTVTGHSMGAGAAVLLTMMLRERPETRHAVCVAFACPAVLTKELAEVCAPFVWSVVTGCDIVPTASAGAVACLREEMRAARRQALGERGGPLIDREALVSSAPRSSEGSSSLA